MNSKQERELHAQSTQSRQRAIVAMFDAIAKDYDKTNRILSLGIDISWRINAVRRAYQALLDVGGLDSRGLDSQRAAREAGFAALRIADVACGSGDMMRHWAIEGARLGIGLGEIVGIDPSQEMLHLAREKISALESKGLATAKEAGAKSPRQEGLEVLDSRSTKREQSAGGTQGGQPRFCFYAGEARELAMLPSASVDILSIAYGLRNVLAYQQALEEFARVLKPSGVLVVLDFFKNPAPSLLQRVMGIYTKHILPLVGYLISRNYKAYKYLPDSMEEFLSPSELAESLRQVGIEPLEICSYAAGISHLVLGRRVD